MVGWSARAGVARAGLSRASAKQTRGRVRRPGAVNERGQRGKAKLLRMPVPAECAR